MKFKQIFAVVSVCVCVIAIFITGIKYLDSMKKAHNMDIGKKESTPPVEVTRVLKRDIKRELTVSGHLRAHESVLIKAEIDGQITKIMFKQGEQVKAGSPLLQIDQSKILAELRLHEAEMNFTKQELDRKQKLWSNSAGSISDLEKAKAEYAKAKANVDVDRIKLSKSTIYAPFDGKVTIHDLNVGKYIQQNEELFTLVNRDPMMVDIKIPEKEAFYLAERDKVIVVVDGLKGIEFDGEIDSIDPKVDNFSHSLNLRVKMLEAHRALLPGMFVRVIVFLDLIKDAMLVPESSLLRDPEGEYLYRIGDNSTAVRVDVISGQREDDMVQIIEGVKEGDQVITAGHQRVQDNGAVRIVAKTKGDMSAIESDLIDSLEAKNDSHDDDKEDVA